MAKKKVSAESMADMSADELKAQLRESEETYFRLRFRHTTSPLKNPMELRLARRQIARIKTWLTQKEVRA